MNQPVFCSRCLKPLTLRERLFESLLCVACEKELSGYRGALPDPNLSFMAQGGAQKTARAEASFERDSILENH